MGQLGARGRTEHSWLPAAGVASQARTSPTATGASASRSQRTMRWSHQHLAWRLKASGSAPGPDIPLEVSLQGSEGRLHPPAPACQPHALCGAPQPVSVPGIASVGLLMLLFLADCSPRCPGNQGTCPLCGALGGRGALLSRWVQSALPGGPLALLAGCRASAQPEGAQAVSAALRSVSQMEPHASGL